MTLPAYRWRFAHLAALWGYGVSQPVFSMLKGNPEFLVVRGSTRLDVIVFALLLTVVAPLVVVGSEVVSDLVSRVFGNALHVVAVWVFSFLAGLQLTRLLDPERGAVLLLPLAIGAVAALAYLRWSPFRSFLSVSLALPVVGTIAFVATVPLAVDDASGANVTVAKPTPVVLVAFDEFPVSSILRSDGTIDAVRYPNFSRLAREATWYPRATSVHEFTTQAVPAILTGQLPRESQLPTLQYHPDNLFTLLGQGYHIRAFEQATRLCPSRYCPRTRGSVPLADRQRGLFYDVSVGYLYRVLPRSIRQGLPPIGERWGGFEDNADVDVRELVLGALDSNAWNVALAAARGHKHAQFELFLQSLGAVGDRRSLYFEHALLPHSPWAFLPSGQQYGSTLTVEGFQDDWVRWGSSKLLVDQALQRHLLQVGYVDRLVGALVQRLRRVGLYDRALVVVTADHGVSFEPGGYLRQVTDGNLADIAGVPLFVKYPRQRRGRLDERDAKTIDILPTIADVVGVRVPWHVDGVSLLRAQVSRPVSVARDGDPVVAAPSAVHAGVLATARRNTRVFGEGLDSLFTLGPDQALLGRPVESLVQRTDGPAVVRLDDPRSFERVRESSGFVPSRIVGEIRSRSVRSGVVLAVAVNGRVEAMTRSFDDAGRTRFAALVPEDVLRNGRNSVAVYAVTREGSGPRLTLLGGTSTIAARSSPAQSADGSASS